MVPGGEPPGTLQRARWLRNALSQFLRYGTSKGLDRAIYESGGKNIASYLSLQRPMLHQMPSINFANVLFLNSKSMIQSNR